jgi:hypothetical protein
MSAPSGSAVNIVARFNVSSPISDKYQLVLSLVDSHGSTVVQTRNNLNNKLLVLPTTLWLGPVSITTILPLPHIVDGTYSIMVGLDSLWGPVSLTPGNGVVEDAQHRYRIGAINLRASALAPSFLPPATLDLSDYILTFHDEFKSLNISDSMVNDGSKWYSQVEQCCMTASDGSRTEMVGLLSRWNPFSLIPGGGLNIRLQKTANVWTSGVLTSVDAVGKGFSQQYGYFEMKAKFPTGIDTWPAFWLLNAASKTNGAPAGEIDIVEYIANPGFPNYISTTLHDWSKQSRAMSLPTSHSRVPLPSDGLHTYGMMWTATTMTFYFDGAVTFQAPTPAIMHQPYYLIVDLGIGAGWPSDTTPSANDMQIKYVRVYEQSSHKPVPSTQPNRL